LLYAIIEIRLMTNDYLRAHKNIVDLLAIAWEGLPGQDATPFRPVLLVELATDESGQPFTLDRYMAQHKGSLVLKQRTEILCDIASGLAAIHALSVVHGDVKPSNILICWGKLQGRFVAKLSDFGFSSIESEGRSVALGTFLWTAPECLPEASEELKNFKNTITRDIYGFGLIIWYASLSTFY
jgi:serine/threonine protein kinase